ncbi:response regulator transcription factor [Jeotgalibacillus sp. R-1-5s-1]|uniref:response regulator transcription factor n=1 Tax=Jeotgalibacillus sp. R-1-5s-1 TaxID=2555897 RepID=UPI00106B3AB1|nr:response regulator [Jeotgalibacillus sp. R-1-5s-1]TFE01834.1 response regulator [Jeotgalibacillus sp. R-1-5s-1]
MKKLLIADDEDILRMLIEDTLEDLDVEISEVTNGREAYERLNEEPFDYLILDYMMPEMTGYEVLEKLSEDIKKTVTIIMLTAKTQKEDQEALMQAGADYFISKPFSPVELADFMEGLFNEQ